VNVNEVFDIDNGSSDPDEDAITLSQTANSFSTSGPRDVILTVTDLYGKSGTCTTRVIVNTPPNAVCKAGPLVVAVSEVFDIDNGSSDPDGDAITKIQTAAAYPAAGSYDVTLTVTDPYNSTSACTTQIIANDPPVAKCKAPGDVIVAVNAPFDIDDGSYDPEDDPTNDPITKSQKPTSYDKAGTYNSQLTVADKYSRSSTCTTSVIVNDPPVAKCKAPGDVIVAVNAPFDIDDGSYDPEDDPTNDPISKTQIPTSYAKAGTYDTQLTVADMYDRSSTCATQVIVNDPPVARCKRTVVATVNRPFNIDNGSYDPEGDPFVKSRSGPESFRSAGQRTVRLTVADRYGRQSSCRTRVVVVPAPTKPPTAAPRSRKRMRAGGGKAGGRR
jgi:PKD repeat protein